jgi:hypothetical protein
MINNNNRENKMKTIKIILMMLIMIDLSYADDDQCLEAIKKVSFNTHLMLEDPNALRLLVEDKDKKCHTDGILSKEAVVRMGIRTEINHAIMMHNIRRHY